MNPTPIIDWNDYRAYAGDVYSLVYQLPTPCEDRFWQSVGTRANEVVAAPRGVEPISWDNYVQQTYFKSGNTWRRISDRVIECWIIVTEDGPLGMRVQSTLPGVCKDGRNAELVSVHYWDRRNFVLVAAMRVQDSLNAGVDTTRDATTDAAAAVPDLALNVFDKLFVVALTLCALAIVITDGGRRRFGL